MGTSPCMMATYSHDSDHTERITNRALSNVSTTERPDPGAGILRKLFGAYMRRAVLHFVINFCLIPGLLLIVQPRRAAAEPVSTAMIVEQEISSDARARIEAFLGRSDVRPILEMQGVEFSELRTRLQALTTAELIAYADQIEGLPAAGDSGVGAVVGGIIIVFLVLLVTDILGLTKVFPFTRSVR